MTGRRLIVLAALVLPALVAAGCGDNGGSSAAPPPPLEQGKAFADGFVQRLVVGGRWSEIRTDVSPLIQKEARSFQQQLAKDNVRQVVAPGQLKNDCPPNPTLGTGSDCFVYRLMGEQNEPISGKHSVIRSTFRLWLEPESGGWQVKTFDYDAKVS